MREEKQELEQVHLAKEARAQAEEKVCQAVALNLKETKGSLQGKALR